MPSFEDVMRSSKHQLNELCDVIHLVAGNLKVLEEQRPMVWIYENYVKG